MEATTWLENQIAVACVCGLGAGLMTLARRGAAISTPVKKLRGWNRWRHGLSGFCLASGVAGGVSLLVRDHLAPMNRIALSIVISACYDVATSEGLAYIARTYLQRISDEKNESDEADDLPEKWRDNGKP